MSFRVLMFAHVKNYLKGVLYGTLTLIGTFILFNVCMYRFVWNPSGEKNVEIDTYSMYMHAKPSAWIAALLIFALGFYIGLLRKIVR